MLLIGALMWTYFKTLGIMRTLLCHRSIAATMIALSLSRYSQKVTEQLCSSAPTSFKVSSYPQRRYLPWKINPNKTKMAGKERHRRIEKFKEKKKNGAKAKFILNITDLKMCIYFLLGGSAVNLSSHILKTRDFINKLAKQSRGNPLLLQTQYRLTGRI